MTIARTLAGTAGFVFMLAPWAFLFSVMGD